MDILHWLEYSALAQIVRHPLYPLIQIVHILGFSVAFGCVFAFDLRLLGYCRQFSIVDAANFLLRFAHLGFAVAFVSGFLLFTTQPTVLVMNPAFQFKLLFLIVAGLNAAVFHWRFLPPLKQGYHLNKVSFGMIAIGLVSLTAWVGIIAYGRMIAYVYL
jgi:hypothetical protein